MAPAYLLRPLLHAAACHAHCARVVYAACRAPSARRCPPCACRASLSAVRLLRVAVRRAPSARCGRASSVHAAERLLRRCRCERCPRHRRIPTPALLSRRLHEHSLCALPASSAICPRGVSSARVTDALPALPSCPLPDCRSRALCTAVAPSALSASHEALPALPSRLLRRRAVLAPSALPRCLRAVCAAALPSRRLRCR